MKLKHLPIILVLLSFLIIKITNLGVRLSDTNIYFDIAYQITQGKIIYRDFFFSNFPLFAYISSLYYFLVGKNLELFFTTTVLEVITISSLIYYITYKKTKGYIVSFLSVILYIFSFIVLSTSDHQTGVFTASLFAVLGYLFLYKKNYFLSGLFVAMSLFTKAYFIPVTASFFVYILLKRNFKNFLIFTITFIIIGLFIVLPSLLLSPKEFIHDIFLFSLSRPAGTLKSDVLGFFIGKDFLFFVILIFNLINFKKNLFFSLISLFSIILFFYFQDVYYLYLNFAIPFLCLSLYEIYDFWTKDLKLEKIIIASVVIVFIVFNLFNYLSGYKDLEKISNFETMTKSIIQQKPKYLYGVNDITPAFFSITNLLPIDNVRDAHEYFFSKNALNKEALTNKAIHSKTIIISHGAYYPDQNIDQKIVDGIFDNNLVLKSCKLLASFPVQAEGVINRINLFKCF